MAKGIRTDYLHMFMESAWPLGLMPFQAELMPGIPSVNCRWRLKWRITNYGIASTGLISRLADPPAVLGQTEAAQCTGPENSTPVSGNCAYEAIVGVGSPADYWSD